MLHRNEYGRVADPAPSASPHQPARFPDVKFQKFYTQVTTAIHAHKRWKSSGQCCMGNTSTQEPRLARLQAMKNLRGAFCVVGIFIWVPLQTLLIKELPPFSQRRTIFALLTHRELKHIQHIQLYFTRVK